MAHIPRIAGVLRHWGILALCLLITPAAVLAAPVKSAAKGKGSAYVGTRISSKYRSPRNSERSLRKSTRFIILHTTEGGSKGSIAKLSANGECNYVVDTDGAIYLIIDRSRISYHAGLSMWDGLTDLDAYSIGIEIVGYHNQDITAAQYSSLKKLLAELKSVYKIPDDKILTHSMVAYGNPNHYHKRRHRGRKRCGMLLAQAENRAKMNVFSKPLFDPDLKAGRLKDADPELTKILYAPQKIVKKPVATTPAQASSNSKIATPTAKKETTNTPPPSVTQSATNIIGPGRSAWDIAKARYKSASTIYVFPDGTRKKGTEIANWKSVPVGTLVEMDNQVSSTATPEDNTNEGLMTIGEDGSAQTLAGNALVASTTFYFPPKDGYKIGSSLTLDEILKLPSGTKLLVGYKCGGPIGPKLRVFSICGNRWNSDDTYYLKPNGAIVPGDEITEKTIPAGAYVFFKN